MNKTDEFLKNHRLMASDVDIDNLVKVFLEDMKDGLAGREGALRMIPTFIEAENDFLREVPVLAIDAGGTNFRASLVRFSSSGEFETGEIINRKMPGLEKEISSDEFFRIIAEYVRPLADKAERIGFCFSYPTEILPSRDGRLLQFCKEVKAPEVVGKLIGKNLLEALGTPDKPIVILNDTVATLLAGKSVSINESYDSFIGFILGTGTNTCYIEQNINIVKRQDLNPENSQIINIESGNFKKAVRTDLDIIFDNSTFDPGNYIFEKMISGGYFGGLSLTVLKAAARKGVFSAKAAEQLSGLTDLSTNDANYFVSNPFSEANLFPPTNMCPEANPFPESNPLHRCFKDKEDAAKCSEVINALIERAAKLVAANLAAVILSTGKGKSVNSPVLITVEGTTFYKMHDFRNKFEGFFNGFLSGERKRYVEFKEVPQSGLTGAALAGLIL